MKTRYHQSWYNLWGSTTAATELSCHYQLKRILTLDRLSILHNSCFKGKFVNLPSKVDFNHGTLGVLRQFDFPFQRISPRHLYILICVVHLRLRKLELQKLLFALFNSRRNASHLLLVYIWSEALPASIYLKFSPSSDRWKSWVGQF